MNKINIIAGTIALGCSASLFSAPNPASQDWVQSYSVPQLSAQDWSAVCTQGTPAEQTGCLGNLASTGFSKLNAALKLQSILNTAIANVPNSVFIQQYFGGAYAPQDPTQTSASITNNSANVARCALYSQQGTQIPYEGLNNCLTSTYDYDYNYTTITLVHSETEVQNYMYCTLANGGTPLTLPVYVICVGLDSTGAPASIQGITAS